MKDEQPTEQTVREILESSEYVDQAEAAINAHIVSVLEELAAELPDKLHPHDIGVLTGPNKEASTHMLEKEQGAYLSAWNAATNQSRRAVDAAIAKYKHEDK